MNFETVADIGVVAAPSGDDSSSPVAAARCRACFTASCNSVGRVTCNVTTQGYQLRFWPPGIGNRACFRAGISCKRQIHANEIKIVKTRKDTRCPIAPPTATEIRLPACDLGLW